MFEGGARFFLDRGQGVQPQARDPMRPPGNRPVGPNGVHEVTAADMEFRRRNAIYHMAMVYRRLVSVDMDIEAEAFNQQFQNLFGEEYEIERARVIQEEPDQPEPRRDAGGDDL